jgi:adenine-specific DNA glycosylase
VSPETVELREAVAVVRKGAAVLLARQEHERGWWNGLWTLPRCPLAADDDPLAALTDVLAERFGIDWRFVDDAVEKKYGVTRHRVTAFAFNGVWVEGAIDKTSRARWMSRGELALIGMPAPDRAILTKLLSADDAADPGVRHGAAR